MLSNGNGEGGDKTFINLKLKSTVWPTEEQPKFVKLDENFKETNEDYSEMKGKLTKIKATHTPAKWQMGDIYWFKAFLEDWEEIYVIESTITNASKDLLNALLVNVWTTLKINLYLNKNKYPSSSVKLEDWNWAQTSMAYNEIDTAKLYDAIVAMEGPVKEEGVSMSDVPF